MPCAICQERRPKRFCPGVHGEICSICCGTEREVTITCPLDCEYLRDARRREKPVPLDAASIPNQDIRISEKFLEENEALLLFLGERLGAAAMETPGVSDSDMRDALQALVRTYRTLQSGVYYESRPENALAKTLFDAVQSALAEFRGKEQESRGIPKTRDADVLGLLVFFERLELDRNNGRRRGRAFIDLLRSFYVSPSSKAGTDSVGPLGSSLVLP
jgi:hypothetical protein